jgi:hypothetical protein
VFSLIFLIRECQGSIGTGVNHQPELRKASTGVESQASAEGIHGMRAASGNRTPDLRIPSCRRHVRGNTVPLTTSGADAVTTFENRTKLLQAQADANRDLSSDLDHDDA